MGAAVDVPVDPLVEVDQPPAVVLPGRARELVQQALGLGPVGVVPALGSESRRLALEHETDLRQARDVSDVDAGDEDPAAREDLDELLAGEVAERLADRRPPHAQLLHQLALADDGARGELERDDQLADRVVRAVREGLLVGRPGLVDVERRCRHVVGRGEVTASPLPVLGLT